VSPALYAHQFKLGEHGRGFFAQLTNKAIRRGAFASVPDLIAAINAYLVANSTNSTPFTWTRTTDLIVVKVRRGRVTLNAITTQNADARLACLRHSWIVTESVSLDIKIRKPGFRKWDVRFDDEIPFAIAVGRRT
jgi:hypothetical protein